MTNDTTPLLAGGAGTASGDLGTVTVRLYAGPAPEGNPVQVLTAQASSGSWAVDPAPLSDGTYTATAAQSDAAGNTGISAPATFVIDTVAPHTVISSGPPATSATSSVTFQFFSTKSPATFDCNLDETGWASCVSPVQYTGLANGSHTFMVRARDQAGNIDPSPAQQTFTIDTSAPHTTISSAPPAITSATAATFVFFSSRADSTFQCMLDGGPWNSYSSPQTYRGLAAGQHVLDVRAIDQAGRVDATPASYTWTIGHGLFTVGALSAVVEPAGTGTTDLTVSARTARAHVAELVCARTSAGSCTTTASLSPETGSPGRDATRLGTSKTLVRRGRTTLLTIRLTRSSRQLFQGMRSIKLKLSLTERTGRGRARSVSVPVTFRILR